MVIENLLGIALEKNQGALRFGCPLCGEFNTAINFSTNLARCFRCETNFNPIDMVMAVKDINFVEAVTLLKKYKENSLHDQKQEPERDRSAGCLPPTGSILNRSDKKPVAIGNILSMFMDRQESHMAESNKTDSTPQKSPLTYRITKLEKDVQRLSEQLNHLKSIFYNQK
jgi:predicted RNA-binding Zn-ribbon protein involved in translation (DUF1610 family)